MNLLSFLEILSLKLCLKRMEKILLKTFLDFLFSCIIMSKRAIHIMQMEQFQKQRFIITEIFRIDFMTIAIIIGFIQNLLATLQPSIKLYYKRLLILITSQAQYSTRFSVKSSIYFPSCSQNSLIDCPLKVSIRLSNNCYTKTIFRLEIKFPRVSDFVKTLLCSYFIEIKVDIYF